MTKLRELAQGMPCQVRIVGVCNHDPSTTVLAHYRLIGVSGAGIKSPDTCGAWACSACHDYCDARERAHDIDGRKIHLLEGVIRTLYQLHRLGYKMERRG